MNSLYPGIALLGGENTAGIYGVNGGIIDAQGVGVQHLFYKSFEQDLIHTACTMVKIDETLYYGNRVHNAESHPIHISPIESGVEHGFRFYDAFFINEAAIKKTDRVFSYGDNVISFETTLENTSKGDIDAEFYGYCVCRNKGALTAQFYEDTQSIISKTGNRYVGIKVNNPEFVKIVDDSPTGFLYRSTQTLLYNEESKTKLETKSMTGLLLGRKVTVKAEESFTFKWVLLAGEDKNLLERQLINFNIDNSRDEAEKYWSNWLLQGESIKLKGDIYNKYGEINLIAAKAACISGFVPADLTGHYYANGAPSYYARDSMMVARAFLLSGHYREFEDIMTYLIKRPTKENGEFYQRYNGIGEPSEGANNNVFHQVDSIGYFARNIRDYYFRTGKMLLNYDKLKSYVNVLLRNNRKKGMIGPEGGVNEGVFGPAYITSSNMFIYGGLAAAIELADIFKDYASKEAWTELAKDIYEGIQSTLSDKSERYYYGYVDYNDTIVRKYDTPQYFGPLYGYPIDEGMRNTNRFYLKNASFYEDGIGYSEQEYHHGPWIFNTAACAEYAAITGDYKEYNKKLSWIIKHGNSYGLMPEAVDGNDERKCMINPLTWACAEFVSAIYIINTEDGHVVGQHPIYKYLE